MGYMPSALPTPDACCPSCPDESVVNIPGPPGQNGSNGTNGTNGTDGHNITIFDQTPEPVSAVEGDIWISPTDVQIKKADLSWQSIVGTAGPAGDLLVSTKGDLLGFSTVPTRFPVGTNGKVLTANSALAIGLGWAVIDLTGAASALSGSLPIANGGTAGTTAATARTNLGAAASGLATASGLTSNTAKVIGRSSGGTGGLEEITCTAFARTILDDASASDTRTTLNVISADYLLYQNQQTSGTSGGTFTTGAWQTVPINTEVADTGGNGALAANIITLATGTYRFRSWITGYAVLGMQTRLYNVDTTSVITVGQCVTGAAATSIVSNMFGRFTLAVPTQVRLEAQCSNTEATDGFGKALSFGTEVFSSIELYKE